MKKCCLPKTSVPLKWGSPGMGRTNVASPSGFVSRDIKSIDPNKEQFAPREGELIPMHQRMAGMG